MVILLRAGLGRADSLPLASPGLTKITPNITHIAMDGLSSQHRCFGEKEFEQRIFTHVLGERPAQPGFLGAS